MRWVVMNLLWLGACVDSDGTEALPVFGSLAAFAERAQPVFEARCANPSCHGSADRPLSVYAVHRHRLDRADVYLDAPLTEDELRHNHLQASIFLVGLDDASRSLLLTKPLSGHAGVEVFAEPSDYDCQRLRAWIDSAIAEHGGSP